jgi:hypothetical protein
MWAVAELSVGPTFTLTVMATVKKSSAAEPERGRRGSRQSTASPLA